MTKPKILVYDIETAGVNALNADLGYMITFGYIWLDDFENGKKWKTISIGDFDRFDKDPHDDTDLIKASIEILNKADGIVHHYGNRFDAPFILTRSLIKGIKGYPDVPMLDTCYLAYKRLKLSSNRLKNIAKVLKCKWQKLEKNEGWPLWWYSYLKGDLKHDAPMRKYCGYDVMTLAEISIKMRSFWPPSFVNRLYPKTIAGRACNQCGGTKLKSNGRKVYQRKLRQRLQCLSCGSCRNYRDLEK